MYQLSGAWASPHSRECTEKLQNAQKVRHQLFVSGYAGKYFPALYFCVGTRLLDAPVWTSSDGAYCCRRFL